MINLKDIEALFQAKDIPYEMRGDSLHYVHHSDKEKVRMHVICNVDGPAFSMLVYGMNAGERSEAVRTAIEEANRKYRYWKFSLDHDNDLVMEYQTFAEYISDTEIYIDLVLVAANIIDDFYPILQRARFAIPEGSPSSDKILE